jgi:hypothetical protein
MSTSGELWYVKLSDGDVHRVTLDQLDEAFQAGHIDAETMVLAAGATRWAKLGALAGIDDDVPIEAEIPAPVVQGPPLRESSFALPSPFAPSPLLATRPQPPFQPPQQPLAPHATAAPRAPDSVIQVLAAYPPPIPVLTSLRPLSVDFGEIDIDAGKLRSRPGKRLFGALIAVAVVGGIAAVAVQRPGWAQPYLARVGLRGGTAELAAAAMTPPPPPPAAEAPPPAEVTPPAPPTPEPTLPTPPTNALSGDSPLSPHFTNQLNDDKKQHADENEPPAPKGKKHKGHAAGPASHGGPTSSKGKSTTFTTGGNKFDPLNSSI